jgi:hypothetical protein
MDITFFNFEAEFVDTLRCVPMIVRFKLDVVGVKLALRLDGRTHWSQLSALQRFALTKLTRGGSSS